MENLQAALDYASKNSETKILTVGDPRNDKDVSIAEVSKDHSLVSLKKFFDEYLEKPERVKGISQHNTAESFLAHIARHKGTNSVVYAIDNSGNGHPGFQAVYNYNGGGTAAADWGDFKAVFNCELSREWKAWTDKSGEPMSQTDFAQFIEDNLDDIIDPPDLTAPENAALQDVSLSLGYKFANRLKMLELSRGVAIHVDGVAKQITSLASGQGMIEFSEQHNDSEGKKLEIPGLFLIGIPVFRDGLAYRVAVKLRYRVSGGRVVWTFIINRKETFFDSAFSDLKDKIAETSKLPLFVGKPEAAA